MNSSKLLDAIYLIAFMLTLVTLRTIAQTNIVSIPWTQCEGIPGQEYWCLGVSAANSANFSTSSNAGCINDTTCDVFMLGAHNTSANSSQFKFFVRDTGLAPDYLAFDQRVQVIFSNTNTSTLDVPTGYVVMEMIARRSHINDTRLHYSVVNDSIVSRYQIPTTYLTAFTPLVMTVGDDQAGIRWLIYNFEVASNNVTYENTTIDLRQQIYIQVSEMRRQFNPAIPANASAVVLTTVPIFSINMISPVTGLFNAAQAIPPPIPPPLPPVPAPTTGMPGNMTSTNPMLPTSVPITPRPPSANTANGLVNSNLTLNIVMLITLLGLILAVLTTYLCYLPNIVNRVVFARFKDLRYTKSDEEQNEYN